VKRILKALKEGGPLHAGRVVVSRIADTWNDYRLGIDASGLIPIESLISQWTDCHDYFPTSFTTFRAAMGAVKPRPGEDVFLDYGSGKGRALVMAAHYPFRRIIGVEISAELNAAARANLDRCAPRLMCKDIDLWTGSAAEYPVPPEANVIFFYNPFHGSVLRQVLANLRASLDAHPRRLTVVYNNPVHFLRMAHEYPWMVERHRFRFEHECVLYEAR
jgi:SAM-dependent methyltransferase